MKAFIVTLAATAIAINVGSNMARNTAESLQQVQDARTEQLCQVNARYCR